MIKEEMIKEEMIEEEQKNFKIKEFMVYWMNLMATPRCVRYHEIKDYSYFHYSIPRLHADII